MSACLSLDGEHSVFEHVAVLLNQVLAFSGTNVATMVDCTLGGAGHATALLQKYPHARLIGIDRDPLAVTTAKDRLVEFGDRVQVFHGRFSQLQDVLQQAGQTRVDLLLADLGVSSPQLDIPERGFSFQKKGPLDMRMDPSADVALVDLLKNLDAPTLTQIIREFGEERHAARVARALLQHQPQDTAAAADIVRSCVPRSKDGLDPATRTFQALRIYVNDELGELQKLLKLLPDVLRPGGRALFISFHSHEDRAVKLAFRDAASSCVCPPNLPVCRCSKVATLKIITKKPVEPTPEEVAVNSRARSAKLRVAERLDYPETP